MSFKTIRGRAKLLSLLSRKGLNLDMGGRLEGWGRIGDSEEENRTLRGEEGGK